MSDEQKLNTQLQLINQLHSKLTQQVILSKSRTKNLINQNEAQFLLAYQDKMKLVAQEFQFLKRKIDEEALRLLADEKFNILQEQRDYFRSQAVRLDSLYKSQKQLVERLQQSRNDKVQQEQRLKLLIIQYKKQNQILRKQIAKIIETVQDCANKPAQLYNNLMEFKFLGIKKRKCMLTLNKQTSSQTQFNFKTLRINKPDDNIQTINQYKRKFKEIKNLISQFNAERSQLQQVFKECVQTLKEQQSRRGKFSRLFKEDKRKIIVNFLETQNCYQIIRRLIFQKRMAFNTKVQSFKDLQYFSKTSKTNSKKERQAVQSRKTAQTAHTTIRVKSAQPWKIN